MRDSYHRLHCQHDHRLDQGQNRAIRAESGKLVGLRGLYGPCGAFNVLDRQADLQVNSGREHQRKNIGDFLLNAIFVVVYALLRNGIPGKNRLTKGLVFGLCVWAVGMLPGMFSTYSFMTVATGVVIYWTTGVWLRRR
jgi:hypothetical protein